jgi:hypothetical protein
MMHWINLFRRKTWLIAVWFSACPCNPMCSKVYMIGLTALTHEGKVFGVAVAEHEFKAGPEWV